MNIIKPHPRALAAFHARQKDTRDTDTIRVAQEAGLSMRSMSGARTLVTVTLLALEITETGPHVPAAYTDAVHNALRQLRCRGLLVVVEGPADACEDFMVTILPEHLNKPALDHYREFVAVRVPYDVTERAQLYPVALADFAKLNLMMDAARADEKPAAGDA